MKNNLVSAIVAVIIVIIAHFVLPPSSQSQGEQKESVYARVMRTETLRCGYNSEPPFVVIDPNTRKVSGAAVDIIEQMGKLLGLKIAWTEQVGWDMMSAGLENNRYDLVCNGKWVMAAQGRGSQYTPTIFFTAVHAYGRADDDRFDDDLRRLNDPAHAVTSIDGEINYYIARDMFPRAQRVEFPSMTDNGQLFEAVNTKKADATFAAGYMGNDYMSRNPGHIKKISRQPLAEFDTAFMFKAGEPAFAAMLEAAIRQMHAAGTINAILDRYKISSNDALRVKLPITGMDSGQSYSPAINP
jgi:ABC-type amino acid transport substrate-binding protein